MGNKTLYVGVGDDALVWAAATRFADANGRSLSQVVTAALKSYLSKEDRTFAQDETLRIVKRMRADLQREIDNIEGKKAASRRASTRRKA